MALAHNINKGQRTQDVRISEDVIFDTMLLTSNTLQGMKSCGFYKPSPIQLHGIPFGKCGFDLILEAKSGTGKTVVFSVIALEKLDLNKDLQVIILAPTREIAAQICDVIRTIGSKYEGLQVEVVMGGLPVQEDIMKFKKKVHIVVGSPGRLRHLIYDKHINVSNVTLIILDEADKLMEKSFQEDINYIFSVIPQQKQVIMSSATYPEKSKSFIEQYVLNAQHICPDSNSILLGIRQKIITIQYSNNITRYTKRKFKELLKILTKTQFKQCLIFCNYQVRVIELYKQLNRENWPAQKLYGQQEQLDRLDALKTLQGYKCRILISTDLAARGIDASNIDLVINFEVPFEWQTYLHRIGRAGRFGSYGVAVTFLCEGKEEAKFKAMLKPVQCSIELRDFWTNDKIDLSSNNSDSSQFSERLPHLTSTVPNNKINKELWEEFSCESLNDIETESFEQLCISYEKSRENAQNESCSDLLLSFENSCCIKEESSIYRHIKIQDISIDENVQNVEKCNHNLNEESEHSCEELEAPYICNNDESMTSKTSLNLTTNNNVCNGFRDDNFSQNQLHHSDIVNPYPVSSKNDKNNVKVFSKCLNNENDTLLEKDIDDQLLRLGLPTSFDTSKGKRNKIKAEKNQANKFQYVEFSTVPIDNQCNKQAYDNNNNGKDTIEYNSKYNLDDRFGNKHNSKNCKRNNQIQQERSQKITMDYNNWYNSLKVKMKYIELAVYIEELTKL